jgi:hypothetical protein
VGPRSREPSRRHHQRRAFAPYRIGDTARHPGSRRIGCSGSWQQTPLGPTEFYHQRDDGTRCYWQAATTCSRRRRLRPSGYAATIPIVFGVAVDPVGTGLIASLNQPGGNLTGITGLNVELGPKRLELLRELRPTATTIALLVNPTGPSLAEPYTRALKGRGRYLGATTPCSPSENRRGFRQGVYSNCPIASRRARDRPRHILQYKEREARGSVA